MTAGETLTVEIRSPNGIVSRVRAPYRNTFGDVPPGEPLLYFNSLDQVALAINQGSFAAVHGVGSGPGWTVVIARE